ncbi:Plug domain-containing protein [Chitinimonas sp. BJB300]|uniref:Plug domain-containing protein n=1 Tax=Chitinimonas sp. BJB300 TaxID=1559339 RepID=UPI000C1123C3|nr:Plug domain-containing protein [Chitinimonas sp. BJB300]PHV09913.1 hypothetical protein CSQ89_19065 [Chitinimonas sp. BJB300]
MLPYQIVITGPERFKVDLNQQLSGLNTYNGLHGLLPRQYLAAELIERVEVLRGANDFLNGAPPRVC